MHRKVYSRPKLVIMSESQLRRFDVMHRYKHDRRPNDCFHRFSNIIMRLLSQPFRRLLSPAAATPSLARLYSSTRSTHLNHESAAPDPQDHDTNPTAPKIINHLARPPYPLRNDSDTRNMTDKNKVLVHENRLNRPPYAPSTDPDHGEFHRVYSAACFCGQVQFEVGKKKPEDAKFCHCPTCQKLHGAPFQWAAILHKHHVRFTAGAEQLVYWNPTAKSADYVLPCKVSCGKCRTPVMDEGRNMALLFPTLIQFPDREARKLFYPT